MNQSTLKHVQKRDLILVILLKFGLLQFHATAHFLCVLKKRPAGNITEELEIPSDIPIPDFVTLVPEEQVQPAPASSLSRKETPEQPLLPLPVTGALNRSGHLVMDESTHETTRQ